MNKWEELDKKYIWHPFTQMKGWVENPQLVIERGDGVKLYDTEGRGYYDGISSLWVNIHGHRRREIDDAIKAQIDKISHSTLLGLINQPSAEFAEKLVEITPEGLNKVFYSDDGSTAVEAAVKIAFQYWQFKGRPEKQQFINLGDSYHGDTVGAVSVGNIDVFHKVYKPLLFATKKMTCPSFYHSKLGFKTEEEFLKYLLDELEDYLKENARHVAAMIIEPLVQAAAGMLMQPKGYIKGVRELTKKYGVLLIVDEVATGFGRTGKMFACDLAGISPDIMCLSKGLTGGYMPMAVAITTQKIFDAFYADYIEGKAFMHSHTYAGNPLACSAACAVLDILEEETIIENAQEKAVYFTNKIKEKFANHPNVGDIRHIGLINAIELVEDKAAKKGFDSKLRVGYQIYKKALKKGVILRPLGNVIYFNPPLIIEKADMDYVIEVAYECLCEVLG